MHDGWAELIDSVPPLRVAEREQAAYERGYRAGYAMAIANNFKTKDDHESR